MQHPRFAPTLMAVALLLGWIPDPLPAQTDSCVQPGKDLISDGKPVEALAALDPCKLNAPGEAEVYFVTGVALMALEDLAEAVGELERAIQLDPGKAEYRLVYADALEGAGQAALARQALEELEPEKLAGLEAPQLWHLADLNFRVDRFQQALEALDRFQELRPDEAGVDFRRGEIYLKQQDLEAALGSFRRATERIPEAAAPYFGMGLALRFRNQLEPSREAFLEALDRDPGNPEYLWQLGEVLLALDRPAEVIERLEPAAGQETALPDLYRVLGEAHRRLGNSPQGTRYMERYRSVTERFQQGQAREQEGYSLAARGEEKLASGDIDEAVGLFQQALLKHPDNPMAHGYLARIYISSGFLERALPHLTRLQELDPDGADGNYLLATYWYQRRDYRRALEYAGKAKARYPGSGELRNLLGNIHVGLGNRRQAVAEYEAAIKLEPDRADFRTNYEYTREAMGRE